MKKTTVLPFRLSKDTQRQLKELRAMGYGNRNDVLRQAINLLHQQPCPYGVQEPYVYVRPSYIRFSQPTENGIVWRVELSQPTDDCFVWLVETEFDTPVELFRYLKKAHNAYIARREYPGSFDYYQDDHFMSIYATQAAFDAATELYKAEMATTPSLPMYQDVP